MPRKQRFKPTRKPKSIDGLTQESQRAHGEDGEQRDPQPNFGVIRGESDTDRG